MSEQVNTDDSTEYDRHSGDVAHCDVVGCHELARYVETGDGHAVRDPMRKCHSHCPDGGMWRDLTVAARRLHREDETNER